MRAACFLVPQLSVAFFFEKKQSPINGLKESPTLSSTDAKESPTLPVGGAMESPIKSANDVQAMYPVTDPMAFVEEGSVLGQPAVFANGGGLPQPAFAVGLPHANVGFQPQSGMQQHPEMLGMQRDPVAQNWMIKMDRLMQEGNEDQLQASSKAAAQLLLEARARKLHPVRMGDADYGRLEQDWKRQMDRDPELAKQRKAKVDARRKQDELDQQEWRRRSEENIARYYADRRLDPKNVELVRVPGNVERRAESEREDWRKKQYPQGVFESPRIIDANEHVFEHVFDRSFMETPTKQSIPIGVEQHAEQESPIGSDIRTSLRGSSRVSEGEESL